MITHNSGIPDAENLNNTIMAIDPSLVVTGWATIKDDKEISGVIKPTGETLSERLQCLANAIKSLILSFVPSKLVIELPAAYSYARSKSKWSGKDLNQGALQKLNLAIGTICGAAQSMGVPFEFVDVTWKGKMNKKMSMLITGKKNHNESDALCLLRFFLTNNHLETKEVRN
jgi:hypothetical protein